MRLSIFFSGSEFIYFLGNILDLVFERNCLYLLSNFIVDHRVGQVLNANLINESKPRPTLQLSRTESVSNPYHQKQILSKRIPLQ